MTSNEPKKRMGVINLDDFSGVKKKRGKATFNTKEMYKAVKRGHSEDSPEDSHGNSLTSKFAPSDGIIMAHSLNILRGLTDDLKLHGKDAAMYIDGMLDTVTKLSERLVKIKKYDRYASTVTAAHIVNAFQRANKVLDMTDIEKISNRFKQFAIDMGDVSRPKFTSAGYESTIKMSILDAFATISPLGYTGEQSAKTVLNLIKVSGHILDASDPDDETKKQEKEIDRDGVLKANIIRNAALVFMDMKKSKVEKPMFHTLEKMKRMMQFASTSMEMQ